VFLVVYALATGTHHNCYLPQILYANCYIVLLWSEMTKLIRVNCKQLEQLRERYPDLANENDTVLVRSALTNLIGKKTGES
jgi:hypothetical protein